MCNDLPVTGLVYKQGELTRPIIGRSLRIVCSQFFILSPVNNPFNPWKLTEAHGRFWKVIKAHGRF